jgi:hypothetical protein
MKKLCLLLLFAIVLKSIANGQKQADSLVLFSDLKFFSEFEKRSVSNFVNQRKDTFNCFLAIDPGIKDFEAVNAHTSYQTVYDILKDKKTASKNIGPKIKTTYSTVHDFFLKKYENEIYFPSIFLNGYYNCVTASALYAMVFDQMQIPYKVMASFDHVYLIANPGEKSVVIETTNPSFEQAIFNGDFKLQYVNYLKDSKLISAADIKNKSTDEIFEEKFKEVREAEFINIIGFQYYNKAIEKFKLDDATTAYELSKKAYFFFPDPQVKTLLYTALLIQIERSKFQNVSDIDYLAQLSRFENCDFNLITGIFGNILSYQLQYTNKETYCDSLYRRLVSKIRDQDLSREINFTYNLKMCYRFANTEKAGYYACNALNIKGNHADALAIMDNYLNNKLIRINDPQSLLDTVSALQIRFPNEQVGKTLSTYKDVAYLMSAERQYDLKKPVEGEKYLLKFEAECRLPVENQVLYHWIETAYRSGALYFYYKSDKEKASTYIERALKFVPGSNLEHSTLYHKHPQ